MTTYYGNSYGAADIAYYSNRFPGVRCSRGPHNPPSYILSCSDKGLVAADGATMVLSRILHQHTSLAVSHNRLGSKGIIALIEGLPAVKRRIEDQKPGEWGPKAIHAYGCEVEDAGLAAIVAYAAGENTMKYADLSSNEIELRHHLPIITSVNASHLTHLRLSNNKLLTQSVSGLFDALDSSTLITLDLSHCYIGSECSASIAAYLTSPRSRALETLDLTDNCFDYNATLRVVDALEYGNFTLQHLILQEMSGTTSGEPSDSQHSPQYPQWQRVPPSLERNSVLAKRTRLAALRCLPCARILINAEPLDPAPSSPKIIASDLRTPPFKLLDLPTELLHLIVRHTSRDPTALSQAQFVRLLADAAGRDGLERSLSARRAQPDKNDRVFEYRQAAKDKLAEAWIESGKWNRWERDV